MKNLTEEEQSLLTDAQLEVYRFVDVGWTNPQIASELNMSVTAVNSRRKLIKKNIRRFRNDVSDEKITAKDRVATYWKNKHDDLLNSKSSSPPPRRNEDNSRILCFGDLHAPYHHKDSLAFLSALQDKYNFTRVIDGGDILDSHAMSFYSTHVDLANATEELKAGRTVVKQVAELFPVVDCVDSNHTSRLYRTGLSAGIPKELLVPYKTLLGVENYDWRWEKELKVTLPNGDKVVFIHNAGANVFLTSSRYGCSVVACHIHTKQNIQYWQSPTGRSFAAQCGCLVDDASPAFSYNIGQVMRSLLGCLVIIDSIPKMITMNLDETGMWDKKID